MVTEAEARVHAHVCADGYTSISFARRNEKDIVDHCRKNVLRKYYHVRYSNTQPLLKNLFKQDIETAYKRRACLVSHNEVEVQGKWIFDRLRKMGALGSHDWHIGPQIFNGTKRVNIEWLKAFFDDEGTVDQSRKRVRVKSVNKKGLVQTRKMLTRVGIGSKITGPNCDKTWYLTIDCANLARFNKLIGFRHIKRERRLNGLLNLAGITT